MRGKETQLGCAATAGGGSFLAAWGPTLPPGHLSDPTRGGLDLLSSLGP